MGIFNGGGAADEINDAMQAQIDAQKAETARQISALKDERLAVVKSGGAAQWSSDAPKDYIDPNLPQSPGGM